MPSISLPVAALAGAGISAAGSLGGAALSASAAQTAANTQLHMFDTINSEEAPFRQFGQGQLPTLNNLLSGNPQTVQGELTQLPGYQFDLTQGLKGVQNGATARGLGVSGAAQKGAAAYATGLASNTYNSQVGNLLSAAGLGQNATAQTAQSGTSAAATAGQYQAGVGSALGAGLQGATSPFAYSLLAGSGSGAYPYVGAGGVPASLAGLY